LEYGRKGGRGGSVFGVSAVQSERPSGPKFFAKVSNFEQTYFTPRFSHQPQLSLQQRLSGLTLNCWLMTQTKKSQPVQREAIMTEISTTKKASKQADDKITIRPFPQCCRGGLK
jgi:hypothetical protein